MDLTPAANTAKLELKIHYGQREKNEKCDLAKSKGLKKNPVGQARTGLWCVLYKCLVLAQMYRKKGRGGQTTPAGLNPVLPGATGF